MPAVPEPTLEELASNFGALESLPKLSYAQALYLSALSDGSTDAEAHKVVQELAGEGVAQPEEWLETPEYQRALMLMHGDPKTFLRVLVGSLAGRMFRALAGLLASTSSQKSQEKGVALAARLLGMMQDQGKSEDPEKVRRLMMLLAKKYPVGVIEASYQEVVDGEH